MSNPSARRARAIATRANANIDRLQGRRVFAWHARHPPRAPPLAVKPRPRVRVGLMHAQRRWRPAPQPTGAQPTHLLAFAKLRRRARAAPLVAPHADERGICASRWCTALLRKLNCSSLDKLTTASALAPAAAPRAQCAARRTAHWRARRMRVAVAHCALRTASHRCRG